MRAEAGGLLSVPSGPRAARDEAADPPTSGATGPPRPETAWMRFGRRLHWLVDPAAPGMAGGIAAAILAVSAAFALDWLVPPVLEGAPLLPFLCAVVVVAWYGGRGPTVLALAVATGMAVVVLQQPVQAGERTVIDDGLRLAVFVASGLLVAALVVGLRGARDRAAREAEAAGDARAQLLTVLDSAAYPIAAVDRDGAILFANNAAAAFFGDPGAATSRPALEAFLQRRRAPADGAGRAVPDADHPIRRAFDGETSSAASSITLESGEARWVEITARPIRGEDGAIEGAVVSWRDATTDHDAEQAREAFTAVLAHELRTPITTVFAGSQLLASRGDRMPPSVRRDVAADICHEATRLNRIAENLLVLSRVEHGQLEVVCEPVLLDPLVESVVRSEGARWPESRFETAFPPGPRGPGMAAPAYVELVLRNLLSNAAKYSPAGSCITTTIEAAGDGRIVRVVDEGPGFDPADADRLFELYYRAPVSAAKALGSGVGLYVCRRLVEAMDGRIWARRGATGGAEFCFTLPLADGPPEP